MGGIVARLLLGVLALAQFAVLAGSAALVLAGRPVASWMTLWRQLMEGPAPVATLVAVAACLLLGVPAALALWRRQGWGVVAGIVLAPLLLPTALLGSGAGPDSLAILFAGHASLGLAIGAGCTLVGLSGIDAGLLRAAACAGVSPLGAYRRVVLPLAMPGIMAGVLLSATASVATSLVAARLVAPSLAELSLGHAPALAALPALGLSPALAVAGVALLLCAAMGAALMLLRRL